MKKIGNEFRKAGKEAAEGSTKKSVTSVNRHKVISIDEVRERSTWSKNTEFSAARLREKKIDMMEMADPEEAVTQEAANAVESYYAEPALMELELKQTEMRNVIGAVQARAQRSVKQRQRRKTQVYQRKLVICFAALLILVNICGFMMTNAFADEAISPALHPYYTSIRIEEGDSLWSIASRYSAKSPMDMQEYISELKRMNQLTSDTIHAGHYLTVVYYK